MRELDRRRTGSVDVRLLWDTASTTVVLGVEDRCHGWSFEVPVEPHEARAAFLDPTFFALRRLVREALGITDGASE